VSTSTRSLEVLMDGGGARATEAGVALTTVIRQAIADGLDPVDDDAQVVSVADLTQLIAARSLPVGR
jgi:hypothetical protein